MTEVNGNNNNNNTSATAAAVLVSPEVFRLVANRKEECVVQITNVSFEAVLFRMLTTCPDRFYVKPTKGVIKPNASVSVSIMLNLHNNNNNHNHSKHNNNNNNNEIPPAKYDDFRLEYCVMGPNDIIEPRCANVPAIIKARKEEGRRLVHTKTLRCMLTLDENNNNNNNNNNKGSGEENELAVGEISEPAVGREESINSNNKNNNNNNNNNISDNKNDINNNNGGKMDPRELEQNTLAEKNRRQLAQQKQSKQKSTILMIFGALVILFGAWFVSS